MIRAIGNSPITQNSAPNQNGNQQAFKGVVIKKVPGDLPVTDFVEFLKAGKVAQKIKGGNMRADLPSEDVFTWNFGGINNVVMGKTKAAEDALYNDLVKRKGEIAGIEISKIDDWA